jgi:hypothetical protein
MSERGGTVDWFLSTQGRITRIVVGSLLIIIGLGIIGGIFGVVLLLLGAVPIASAAYGTFLLAPFFGRGIRGEREGGAPTDEEPEPEEDEEDDGEAREDESGQEQGGSRRGEEESEEPQEQLEKDAPGDTTATRDQDAGDGRRDRASSGGGGEESGDDAEDRPASSRGGDTRPMRAERPSDQGPRTKDLRAEDPGSSGESG